MRSGRVLAGSIVASLVWPWLMVLAMAAQLSLQLTHVHDVVDHVADALHGHEHEPSVVPPDHDAAPGTGKVAATTIAQMAAVRVPAAATISVGPEPARRGAAKPSPTDPPTASPPILRV